MSSSPVTAPDDGSPPFADWCRRLRASDRTAFAAVFETLHVDLMRYAWRFTGDEHSARDVVQDVFLKLWRVRETLQPERSLRALLYTMTRNLALNHNRARQHHADPTDATDAWPAEPVDADAALDAARLGAHLEAWIAALPARRREAFQLSRYQGLSHDEIADVMGLTPRTVNTHIVLALKDLRARLGALHPDSTAA